MHGRKMIGTIVKVAAGDIHSRDDGPPDRPALLLLHGSMCSIHWYDRLTPLLATRYRVIRLDLLGHGSSAKHSASLNGDAQARMITDVLDQLGVQSIAAAVGHSFGADAAIALAEQTSRVNRLVIIAQAADYTHASLPAASTALTLPPLAHALQTAAPTCLIEKITSKAAFAPGFEHRTAFDSPDQLTADFRATTPRLYRTLLVERRDALTRQPLHTRLRDLGTPSLVILGKHDHLYQLRPTRAQYDTVPTIRVEVLDNSGHTPQLEQPQRVANLLTEFVPH